MLWWALSNMIAHTAHAMKEWSLKGQYDIKCHLICDGGTQCTLQPFLGLEGPYALIATPLGLVYMGLSVAGRSGYCCCARAEAWLLKSIFAIWGDSKALGVSKHILQQLPLLLHQVIEQHEPSGRLQLQCTQMEAVACAQLCQHMTGQQSVWCAKFMTR